MTRWDAVVEATEDHEVEDVHVIFGEDRAWVYTACICGASFQERWEFTDHIRRIVFDAIESVPA